MNRTAIEWVVNPDGSRPGWSWNPLTGCLNGCEYCYARKLAHGRLKQRYLANGNVAPFPDFIRGRDCLTDPFYPRFWIHRAREEFGACTSGAEPKGIFVCDMGELFGDWVPEEWTRRILNKIGMSYYREHRFYLLTKQPQNLPQWSPFPDNCWVGITATGYKAFNEALDYLKGIEAKVKFISIEPLLEAIPFYMERLAYCGIHWLIIGACTGRKAEILELCQRYPDLTPMPYGRIWTAQPNKLWICEIIEACDKAGISMFLKDNLRPLLPIEPPYYKKYLDDAGNTIWRLRQEMPR